MIDEEDLAEAARAVRRRARLEGDRIRAERAARVAAARVGVKVYPPPIGMVSELAEGAG